MDKMARVSCVAWKLSLIHIYHKEDFLRHYGIDIELVRVCSREPEQAEAHGVADLFTEDFNDIINDPEIDIVIDVYKRQELDQGTAR